MLKMDKQLLVIAGACIPWSIKISLICLMIFYLSYGINLSRVKSKILAFYILSIATIAWYIFFGMDYFKPNPLTMFEAVAKFSVFALILPLSMLRLDKFVLFAKVAFMSIYIYCASNILWTLHVSPSLLTVSRKIELITTGEYVNSPGIMNVLAVCVLGLIYLNVGLVLRLVLYGVGVYVVALGQSRTGMILLVLGLGFELAKSISELSKRKTMKVYESDGIVKLVSARVRFATLTKTLVFALGVLTLIGNSETLLNSESYNLMSQRFERDGMESNRSKHLGYGIEKIMSGSGFLGDGKGPENIENTYWYHNIFLDAYRVGGMVGLILSLIFGMAILSILKETLKYSYMGGVLVAACLFLYMSTVPIEGFLLEFIAPYFLIAAIFLVRTGKPRQVAKKR